MPRSSAAATSSSALGELVARARIDEEETGYPAPFSESPSWRSSAPFGWAPSAAAAGSPSLKRTMVGIEAIP